MTETEIVDIRAREILDSRGNPTVEVEVELDGGYVGRAAVPSGASTGAHEAVELRDGDKGRYGGKGVLKAVEAVNGEISDALGGFDADDQAAVDRAMIELDGTPRQGAAGRQRHPGRQPGDGARPRPTPPACRSTDTSAAFGARVLPTPMMNIINGGAHADNPIDIQEFMILPAGAESFSEALRVGAEIFHSLRKGAARTPATTPTSATRAASRRTSAAPTRRWASSSRRARRPATRPGDEIVFALDAAASEFFKGGRYALEGEGQGPR